LMLRQDTNNPKTFRITNEDLEGNVQTLHAINLRNINRVEYDNLTRMRLLGPATNGNRYWFDLEFKDPPQFMNFRNNHVFMETTNRFVYKG
jgi:hypothetical protein